jgi:plasmid stabilization system protein ParE
MDRRSYPVVWKERAKRSLQNIFLYIYKKSPDNAIKFNDKLIGFGESLGELPDKYQIAPQKPYKKRKFRRAVYKSNYVFFYKVINDSVVIFNIVHAKRLR